MNDSTSAQLSASSTAQSSDKLSGQLIIKAQLGDDIRKMMIHNEDLTLNELVLMMERIFAGKISNSDELTIKYLDDDGDKVTLLNDSDLTVALHFHKILRLFVLVNGNEQFPNNTTDNSTTEGSLIDAKTFRTELQQIRNSVQTILDRLQLSTNQETRNKQETETTTNTTVKPSTPVFVPNTTREFDPFKNLQTQRSTTPDSIRSRSSNSNKVAGNMQKSFQSASPESTANTQLPPPQQQQQQQQQQQYYQSSDSTEANKPPTTMGFQPTQHFSPTGYNDQQNKTATSAFGGPPSSVPGMPPLPASALPRFQAAFPTSTLPSSNAPSAFNTSSASAPPSTTAQTSTFIGQQQPQFTPVAPPPQGGFYGQQHAMMQQQKSYMPPMGSNMNTPNAFGQSQAPPATSSSPATINPSFVQPTGMPAPPPLASQQPYPGYAPQNNYYNSVQQFPKTS